MVSNNGELYNTSLLEIEIESTISVNTNLPDIMVGSFELIGAR